ncbi:hypothetical protein [Nostoc sp.]|uniref:hypothetical protein n=1 Tax=Nostoc sp. TaxID=1180 RepID=UPI002FF46505
MQFLIRLLSFPNQQEKQDWKSSYKAEIAAIAQISALGDRSNYRVFPDELNYDSSNRRSPLCNRSAI